MGKKDNTSYEEYLQQVKQEVALKTGKRVELQTIRKNNGLVLNGLLILSEETNLSPTIYLNNYYEEFITDGMERVVERIVSLCEENRPEISFDISLITDFSKVKPFLKMKLINYEKNKVLLEEIPHKKILDLAVVFMIVLETEDDYQFGTIQINKAILAYWDIKESDLYNIAKENMVYDFQTIPMQNIISAIMEDEFTEEMLEETTVGMYVLTTHSKLHGAVGMLNKELLNAFMKRYKTEKLIILPSSIHEVLLIPYNQEMSDADMNFKETVQEVNETQLAEAEYLSDNVYVYDGKTLKIFE